MLGPFDNSYACLPPQLYRCETPTCVRAPQKIALNMPLAERLGMDMPTDWPLYAAGNLLAKGTKPITMAYAGHQFGHFNPQLGDGRAVLLGEILTPENERFDVQLKGSGPTFWSRGGDGRAALGPVLREYLVSNAMAALSIPTSMALAAVSSGESVWRDAGALPGAILTRIATSHIRVGTFQYCASRNDMQALEALFTHTCQRHFPTVRTPAGLLAEAVQKQAALVAKWMGIGFIHGVMNTDNCHVAGLTLDYGPCAFMDYFESMKVFSSIDHGGRYAYGNQPQIAAWNMAQFATALLPLADDRTQAIAEYTEIVNGFGAAFVQCYRAEFAGKLGIRADASTQTALIEEFINLLTTQRADFTNSFCALEEERITTVLKPDDRLKEFLQKRQEVQAPTPPHCVNPKLIPRNHLIEQSIKMAEQGDFALFHALHTALQTPYQTPFEQRFQTPPKPDEIVHRTFCGT